MDWPTQEGGGPRADTAGWGSERLPARPSLHAAPRRLSRGGLHGRREVGLAVVVGGEGERSGESLEGALEGAGENWVGENPWPWVDPSGPQVHPERRSKARRAGGALETPEVGDRPKASVLGPLKQHSTE